MVASRVRHTRRGRTIVVSAGPPVERRSKSSAASSRGRRRAAALAIGEASLEVVGAIACELWGRPPIPGEGRLGPTETLASLLPSASPRIDDAQAALEAGERKMEAGEWEAAADDLSKALELAPRQYKLAQKALLKRTEAYRNMGDSKRSGEDFRRQWLWGRGVRWPGWYLLGYVFARRAFVDDAPSPEAASPDGKVRIPSEWFLVLALVVLYNVILYKNL